MHAVGAAPTRSARERLPALAKQVNALAAWIQTQGIAPHYSRELRDLDDARPSFRCVVGFARWRLISAGTAGSASPSPLTNGCLIGPLDFPRKFWV